MAVITTRTNQNDTTRRLAGRQLRLARVGWAALAAFYIGAFVLSIPFTFAEMPQVVPASGAMTAAQFLERLAAIGISPQAYLNFMRWTSVFLPAFYIALGLIIFWRKPDDPMALLTSLVLIVFLNPLGRLKLEDPIGAALALFSNVVVSNLLFLWFFVFPTGGFVPRLMRWLFVFLVVMQVWRIIQPGVYEANFPIFGLIIFTCILISQVYRFRHASAIQRQQTKAVVFGISVGLMPLLLFFLAYFILLAGQPSVEQVFATNFYGNYLWYFFVLVFPISITVAILRYRLFDIDVIIRRTLVYGVLTALLVLLFFAGVTALQQLSVRLTGQQSDLALVISTLVIAALALPLRNRVQSVIDRCFYRRKYDAQQALEAFGVRLQLQQETDVEGIAQEVRAVIHETLQPKSEWVYLAQPADKAPSANLP